MTPEEALRILDEMARFRDYDPSVWQIMLQQVQADTYLAKCWTIAGIVLGAMMIIISSIFIRYKPRLEATIAFLILVGIVATIIGFALFASNVNQCVSGTINPEFVAITTLMKFWR